MGMQAREASNTIIKNTVQMLLFQNRLELGTTIVRTTASSGPSDAYKYHHGVNPMPFTSHALRRATQTPNRFIGMQNRPKIRVAAQERYDSSNLLVVAVRVVGDSLE